MIIRSASAARSPRERPRWGWVRHAPRSFHLYSPDQVCACRARASLVLDRDRIRLGVMIPVSDNRLRLVLHGRRRSARDVAALAYAHLEIYLKSEDSRRIGHQTVAHRRCSIGGGFSLPPALWRCSGDQLHSHGRVAWVIASSLQVWACPPGSSSRRSPSSRRSHRRSRTAGGHHRRGWSGETRSRSAPLLGTDDRLACRLMEVMTLAGAGSASLPRGRILHYTAVRKSRASGSAYVGFLPGLSLASSFLLEGTESP